MLSPLPTSSLRGFDAPGTWGRGLHIRGPRSSQEPGVPEGVWLPSPKHPRLRNQLLGSGCERRQPGGPGGACGGRRPRPTSSSRVTVFLQLCSRVVKLDVVGEL